MITNVNTETDMLMHVVESAFMCVCVFVYKIGYQGFHYGSKTYIK